MRGILGALGAGVLWGTMYIPYRKAYITGMSPLSFVAFFTFGELGMMFALGAFYTGGISPFFAQLSQNRGLLFWLLLGGFIWVIGDLFQQYAAKYVGISRGIPLSNTNQLWGLLWGILVFGELRGAAHGIYAQVIGGSLLMALGAGAIALSSANESEHTRWRDAAERESRRYGLNNSYVQARLVGEQAGPARRSWFDVVLIAFATMVIIVFAKFAAVPQIEPRWGTMAVIAIAMIVLAVVSGFVLWKTTKFS
jgi:drug/metabolite transporter (DMT)-like permease